jgi:hypothetical protein
MRDIFNGLILVVSLVVLIASVLYSIQFQKDAVIYRMNYEAIRNTQEALLRTKGWKVDAAFTCRLK